MRTSLLLGICLLCGCASSPARDAQPEAALVQRAIDAAGGEAALTQATTLRWTGTATVFAGDRRIDLGVDTVVTPFHSARSTTWLAGKHDTTQRTLLIDGAQGWLVRDGKREPMPAGMLAQEQKQYAVYGLMRLVSLRDPGVVLKRLADMDGLRVLHVQHPQAAPAVLYFDDRNRLVALEDHVPDAETGADIAQRFTFEGERIASGVHWPQTLRIAQNGKPFFELQIESLQVGDAAGDANGGR